MNTESQTDRITQLEAALVIANQSISEMQPALGKLKDQLQAVEAQDCEIGKFQDEVRDLVMVFTSVTQKEVWFVVDGGKRTHRETPVRKSHRLQLHH